MVNAKHFSEIRIWVAVIILAVTYGVREFHKVAPIVKEKISTAEERLKKGYVLQVNFCHIPCGSIVIKAQ